MLDIQKILSRKNFTRQHKSIFGVDKLEFDTLLKPFSRIMSSYEEEKTAKKLSNPNRKNKVGGGAKSIFADYNVRLAFVLYYLKQYPTFDTFGAVYGITGSHANRLLHTWYPLLFSALQELEVMPETDFKTPEQFQAFLKDKDIDTILADVTERLIQRPKYGQEDYYSGKKKTYSQKHDYQYHN